MVENQPAPSNSRQKYSISKQTTDFSNGPFVKVSIDRITVVADYPTSKFERLFRDELSKLDFVVVAGSGFKLVDTTVNVGSDSDDNYLAEQVAYINVPRFQKDKLRIDFNPNHSMDSEAGQWLLKFVGKLETKHFTRCDIAFDIFNVEDAKKYRVWNFGQSVNLYLNRSLELETAYFGSPSSTKQIRMYNKLVEQKKRHKEVAININHWWRLELQLRGKNVNKYPEEVKQMLSDFYYPEWQSIANPTHKAIVYSMYNQPSIYASASKSTQHRWRRIFKSADRHNELALALANVFVDSFDSLNYQLHDILNRFDLYQGGN